MVCPRLSRPPSEPAQASRRKSELDSAPLLTDNLPGQAFTERDAAIAERNAQIRMRWANGDTMKQLCEDYGLSVSRISIICRGVGRQVNPKEKRNAEIRQRYANGESEVELSREYNLSLGYMTQLCNGARKNSVKPERESQG